MRRLVYVPMIHSPETLRHDNMSGNSAYTERSAAKSARFSDRFWEVVDKGLNRLPVGQTYRIYPERYDSESVRLEPGQFHEADPIGRREALIFGSFLNRVGGIVETTEDARLREPTNAAWRELGQLYARADAEDVSDALGLAYEKLEEVNRQRDRFIAERIAATLQPDEVGVLFLGAGHDPISLLPKDIQVEPLDPLLVEIHRESRAETRREGDLIDSAGGENKA